MRRGLTIQDVIESCKVVTASLAIEDIQRSGAEPTVSRVSVLTGMHRRDAKRLMDAKVAAVRDRGLTMRVLGRWQTDTRFCTAAKKPRVLSCGTVDSEFSRLTKAVSKDLNPATVLFELERVGAVKRTPYGVKLSRQSYSQNRDHIAGLKLLASDVDDLASTVDENLCGEGRSPNLHATTEFDAIRQSSAEEIRTWLLREGHAFHKRVRQFLAGHDQELSPQQGYSGKLVKVVLGTFGRFVVSVPEKLQMGDKS